MASLLFPPRLLSLYSHLLYANVSWRRHEFHACWFIHDMTFNIIYWDMKVCISTRPAGTFVCPCACVTEVERSTVHFNMHMHALVCVCVSMWVCVLAITFACEDLFFVWEEIVANYVCDKVCLGQWRWTSWWLPVIGLWLSYRTTIGSHCVMGTSYQWGPIPICLAA